ncbi:formamidopyrimidine-DNA glycosylase [Gracilibacillus boraciitolerans JCM 21714]|uniref:Formamidopyrimidine-DNA glycosylase n=1 Tax=Gracilibacillus boraciitolerans JCM 21714 TaxID=1298598 RepID=W4VIG5_9BACI|nr:DNA-formamidopyrimidine glycosylase [Gracilibacillus boraciitolerans]GAE93002.1 formamidopyrimidine-DNA glycosylase [Gracilibacillus boraciitolerans JCM 21714]
MPELPEVETIRQTLKQLTIGKTIQTVDIYWPKIIQEPDDYHHFIDLIKNQTIHDIRRKGGKFLLFDLNQHVLVSHLRMEGKYGGVYPQREELMAHTHVVFHFTDGTDLRYRDVRKLGTMHLQERGTELTKKPLLLVAQDPLEADFSLQTFQKKVQKSERNIKNILLDQSVIAGLGNIYVDETLFMAGIHPLTKGLSVTDEQVIQIVEASVATLKDAVKQGGTTIRSYVNSQGQIGMFQQKLNVYGQNDKACRKCEDTIMKIKVNGRGTHYCPSCQPI